MTLRMTVLVGAIAGILALTALQLLAPRATPADPRVSERLERTETRLGNLQREVATRRASVTRVETPPSLPASAGAPTAEEPPPVEPVDEVTALDDALETEGTDPSWWRGAERDLANAYASPKIAHSRPSQVRCGSSFCRMLVTHDDAEANQAFREQVALLNPFPDSSVLVQDRSGERGELESVVFVARSGHGLARVQ